MSAPLLESIEARLLARGPRPSPVPAPRRRKRLRAWLATAHPLSLLARLTRAPDAPPPPERFPPAPPDVRELSARAPFSPRF